MLRRRGWWRRWACTRSWLTLHGTGTAAKEAVRQFHDLLVLPIGRAVEEEASRLFREPVRLRWDVGDDRLLIRGRMLAGLLKDGVDPAVAWQVSRLDESAPMPTITTPKAPKAGGMSADAGAGPAWRRRRRHLRKGWR